MTAKQKVAGSNPVSDGFSACTLLAVVGFVGRSKSGEESQEGQIRTPLSMYQSSQPNLAAKQTVKKPLTFLLQSVGPMIWVRTWVLNVGTLCQA